MKYHYDIQQNTPEWLSVRSGKFTASMFADLFSAKSTAKYQNAINTVVYQRLTNGQIESFSNEWTERGHELEPEAIEAYELLTFNKVRRVGFVEFNDWVGCSPDGLVGEDGLLQVKCPKHTTLIDYRLSGEVPKDYMIQMQGELMVTGRKYNEFFCYHPNLKPFYKRIERDEAIIAEIRKKLDEATEETNKRIERLK